MKEITTDNFSFEKLRKSNALYVDKTQYVWDLVNSAESVYFLSRPRRFGKSLLLSTLEAFFLNKREIFKGLAINELAPDDVWQEWPVIHLDMAQASSGNGYNELVGAMDFYMEGFAEDNDVAIKDGMHAPQILDRIVKTFFRKTGKQVVVLIDEYDKPMLDSLHTDYIDKVVNLMQAFYQMLKSNVAIERFVFITGVTKFSHTSLFSGVNNLTDISQVTDFATMLGYTEQELRDNFAEYIDLTAQRMNMDREVLIDKMKLWYDGFRFTSGSAHVFNPVSVGKFFRKKEFQNFWFATGTPSFLVKLMRENPFMLEDFTREWASPIEMDKHDATSLEPKSLAFQTGYITIADVRTTDYGKYYRYDFPNEEIRRSWCDCMLDITSTRYTSIVSEGRLKLDNAFYDGNVEQIMQLLKSLFAGVTKDHLGIVWEGYYRNMMYAFFTAFGVDCHSEEQVAGGIVDIVVKAYSQVYVFELKVSKTGTDEDIQKLLGKGIDQATRNHYADKYHFETSKVHIVSVVFEHKHHQLVAWRNNGREPDFHC